VIYESATREEFLQDHATLSTITSRKFNATQSEYPRQEEREREGEREREREREREKMGKEKFDPRTRGQVEFA